MSVPAIRDSFNLHFGPATGLAALVAALDARASGTALHPALAARVQELLAALGASAILDDVGALDAKHLVSEFRHQLCFNAKLMYPETRATSWSYADAQLLQEIGDFARGHAKPITQNIVPALEGLS